MVKFVVSRNHPIPTTFVFECAINATINTVMCDIASIDCKLRWLSQVGTSISTYSGNEENIDCMHGPRENDDSANALLSSIRDELNCIKERKTTVSHQFIDEIVSHVVAGLTQRSEGTPMVFHSDAIEDPVLWWAGKKLESTPLKTLFSDYLGSNDKCTIKVELQSMSDHPPLRQATVDGETYKNMLSYYHKQNALQKKLADDDDDSYRMEDWSNPRALKNTLIGNNGTIQWKL